MASGSFPLSKNGENGKRLLQAAALINEVIEDMNESVFCGDSGQFDNAAMDGGSLALLRLASSLCKDEVS